MALPLGSCTETIPVHTIPVALSRSSLPQDAVKEVSGWVEKAGGLDLQSEDPGRKVDVPGWEGFPTLLSTYHKKDSDGTIKSGKVIMLNPSSEQTARWIVQALIDATGSYDAENAQALVRWTVGASGFQFVIRGVHWEDMTDDGISRHTAYPFIDGVTVKLKRFGDTYPTRALTEGELDYTLTATEKDVILTAKYARIQSTTRSEYQAAGGKKPVDGHQWRHVVRELYQAAWGNDRNELMSAKAKAMF